MSTLQQIKEMLDKSTQTTKTLTTSQSTSTHSKAEKCLLCDGMGFEKRDPVPCPNCDGKICYQCENKGGYIVHHWEPCRKCGG